jgi:hypothetical protein
MDWKEQGMEAPLSIILFAADAKYGGQKVSCYAC